jgi:hypothetical protein
MIEKVEELVRHWRVKPPWTGLGTSCPREIAAATALQKTMGEGNAVNSHA